MLNKTTIELYRKELNRILEEYAKKKGIQISIGTITYDANSFTAKVRVVIAESVEEVERIDFEKCADLFGLKRDDYGKQFEAYGNKYTLVGIKPKGIKYPFIVKKEGSDKRYKLPMNDYLRKQIGVINDGEAIEK